MKFVHLAALSWPQQLPRGDAATEHIKSHLQVERGKLCYVLVLTHEPREHHNDWLLRIRPGAQLQGLCRAGLNAATRVILKTNFHI